MPQALYCRTDTQLSVELMYIICIYMKYTYYVEVSVSEWNSSYELTNDLPLLFPTRGGCVWCDNIGLVSLILLGWELRASYITVLCVQAVMILSPLLLMPSLYSHLKNFTLLVPYF